jgi:putative membrane protein
MLNLLADWILSALALLVVAHVVPGFEVAGFGAALVAAIAIGLANATLGVLLKILTFPLTIFTLGIFWFIINAFMLKIAAGLVPGFCDPGFPAGLPGGDCPESYQYPETIDHEEPEQRA